MASFTSVPFRQRRRQAGSGIGALLVGLGRTAATAGASRALVPLGSRAVATIGPRALATIGPRALARIGPRALATVGSRAVARLGPRALVPYAGRIVSRTPRGRPAAITRLARARKGTSRSVGTMTKKKSGTRAFLKRVGAAALGTAGAGALTMGVDYAIHKSKGGASLTAADMKRIAMNASLDVMNRGLRGKVTGGTVKEALRDSTRRMLMTKPRTGRSRAEVAKRLSLLRRYMDMRAKEKKAAMNPRGRDRRLPPSQRPFGTGRPKKKRAAAKRKGGKRTAKKKKKKRAAPKKKKKKTKKKKKAGGGGGRRSGGFAVMNVGASRARLSRRHDVFDI